MAVAERKPRIPDVSAPKVAGTPKAGRLHRATYARDNRKGGYMIRVEGPTAAQFAGREVPVTRMDQSEATEKLLKLIWTGPDKETGKPVALYSFQAKPREEVDAGGPAF